MRMQTVVGSLAAGALALGICGFSGPAAAQALDGSVMDATVRQELTSLSTTAPYGAFLHFAKTTSRDEQDRLLAQLGLTVKADFRRYTSAVFAEGSVAAFLGAATVPGITYVEHNAPLRYFGETQPWATRLRVAQEPVSGGPYYADAAKTQILDGSGVTLGVIDSGMLGAHPDFADNLLYNYKVVSITTDSSLNYVDVGKTDSESQVGGHGTHVTGTVGGGGQASNGGYPAGAVAPNIPGTFTGAAPGADLIHWGNGLGILVLNVALAYEHLLDNFDAGTAGFDTLVAVNNSYGAIEPANHNPNSIASQLVRQIIDRGIVMAFAAGNDGGDGTAATTSPECRNPYPGVICVASYNDGGTGARDAALSGFSSRGQRNDASTASFPDIATPGDAITSTCIQGLPSQAICTGTGETEWAPFYGTISGTSMATPHLVGMIGLVQQAYMGLNDGRRLTPAQIEELFQRTALRIGDGYVPDPQARAEFAGLGQTSTHFGFGAGLADLPAVLAAINAPRAGLPESRTEFTVFEGDRDFETSDDVLKLTITDATIGGENGQLHRLTLAASDSFFADTLYSIERNVAGRAFTTSVVTDANGNFSNADIRNTAPATEITRDGAVVSVFVPNSAVGSPAVGEPVHNIRVVVTNGPESYDFAPSPNGSLNPELDRNSPMFGRSFTVGLTADAVQEVSLCDSIGPRVLRDNADDVDVEGLSPLALPLPQQDLIALHVAHPTVTGGTAQNLVIRLRLGSTTDLVPGSGYFVSFDTPDGLRGVRMQVVDPAAPEFFWYVPGASNAGAVDGRFVTSQTPIEGEIAGDEIVFRLPPSTFGFDATQADKAIWKDFNAGVTQSTDPLQAGLPRATFVTDAMPNGLTRIGRVTVKTNEVCVAGDQVNQVPIAQSQSVSTLKNTAVTLTLTATDGDGDALSYAITRMPTNGTISLNGDQVTYTPSTDFTGNDSFQFKANDGKADSAAATVSITVAEPMSSVLDARLVASHQGQPIDPGRSYDAPLAVRLDAGSSTVPAGRQIASVTFHLGDNSTVTQNCATVETCTVFNTTYEFAGRYEPFVVVTDSSGQRDTSDPLLIKTRVTVTADPADPDTSRTVAQLILRDANGNASTAIRGQVPLTVTMDGSNSVAAAGRSITMYKFDFGDGRIVETAQPTATHTYTVPNAYEPTLTVTDSTGATSTSKAAVAVNPAGSGGGSGGGSTGDGGGTGGGSSGGDGGTGGGIVTPPGNSSGSQPLVVRQDGGGAIGSLALMMLGGGWLLRRRVSRVAR
jgi:serine protease AprX